MTVEAPDIERLPLLVTIPITCRVQLPLSFDPPSKLPQFTSMLPAWAIYQSPPGTIEDAPANQLDKVLIL